MRKDIRELVKWGSNMVAEINSTSVVAKRAVILPTEWQETAVTVVIPTYNEVVNLPLVIDALDALMLTRLSIIVVDDGSPDGTGALADELAMQWNASHEGQMRILHRSIKDGLGRAYLAGMIAALTDGAEFVVQMDADLSHPAASIPTMLGVALSTEAGCVIGSRYVNGGKLDETWTLSRRLLSKWANFYVNRILHLQVRDVTAGFKLWSAETLRRMDLTQVKANGYSFQVECNFLAHQQGSILVEVPIYFQERAGGESKMSLAVKIESAIQPWTLRYRSRR